MSIEDLVNFYGASARHSSIQIALRETAESVSVRLTVTAPVALNWRL